MTGSRRPLRRSALVTALAVAASVAALAGASRAGAVGTPAGAATVKSSGGAADLGAGDSLTAFTLRLPTGASCPGDSQDGGYFVQSYIVPAAVDPATLQFDNNGPTPSGVGADLRQPMYEPTTQPYVDKTTAPASPAPGPGPIINIPDFSFLVYQPGNIPAGTYNVGIACTKGGPSATQLHSFWNTQMTFATNATGGPAQVTWTAAASQTTTTAPVASTTAPGATSTTLAGATTTTRPTTTTTRVTGTSTSTTTAGGTTTTTAGGATTTTAAGGSSTTAPPLARTGGSSVPLLVWAALLLVLGRMVVLVVRSPEVRLGGRK
ncbi:MAG TPA: hypothetical protein VF244_03945 [Acidimicrobiales bacterium]